jgi:hypothetical protein
MNSALNRSAFTRERYTMNPHQSQGDTTMSSTANDTQTELNTDRAELATLEADSPKFAALLVQHAEKLESIRPDIAKHTKAGDLTQANTVLDEVSALDAKIKSLKEAQAAHELEVNTARSKVAALDAEVRRQTLTAQAVELSKEMRETLERHDEMMLEMLSETRAKVKAWLEVRREWPVLREKWLTLSHALGVSEPGTQILKGGGDNPVFSAAKAAHREMMTRLKADGADVDAALTSWDVISLDQYKVLIEWQNPITGDDLLEIGVRTIFIDALEALRTRRPLNLDEFRVQKRGS